MDVFAHGNYRKILNTWIDSENERGAKTKLAKAAGCSPSWLTRILSEDVQITPDQAYGICSELHFSELEEEYFLCLVEIERAASLAYRKKLQKKLDSLRTQNKQLKSALKNENQINDEFTSRYYSSWIFASIHVACMIRALTADEVARMLNVKLAVATKTLKALTAMGLIKADGGKYEATSKNMHLPSHHPLEKNSHSIWRHRTVQFLQEGNDEGLHYSGIHCLAKDDVEKIHLLLKESILKSRKIIQDSPSEILAVFCLDWFTL